MQPLIPIGFSCQVWPQGGRAPGRPPLGEGPGDRAKRASHRHVRRAGGDQYCYIPPAGLHAG